VEDFFRHGAGTKGIFLSRCKATGKMDSVALLSKPATDKNLFYISTFAWAVETFQCSVDPDFTLKDGVTICAAMTCVCNAELIVYALVSGALHRRWASRHSSCLGPLGLLFFEVGRQRNGGVHNVGSGCTRRTQPWINTRMLDSEKYRRLLDCTVELCTQVRHSKPNTECTQEGYETVLQNLQVALQG
jgi:uncharacterized protein YfcZ (UPF0381/DUF406 family)